MKTSNRDMLFFTVSFDYITLLIEPSSQVSIKIYGCYLRTVLPDVHDVSETKRGTLDNCSVIERYR